MYCGAEGDCEVDYVVVLDILAGAGRCYGNRCGRGADGKGCEVCRNHVPKTLERVFAGNCACYAILQEQPHERERHPGEDDLRTCSKYHGDDSLRTHLAYHGEDIYGQKGDDGLLNGKLDDGSELVEAFLEGLGICEDYAYSHHEREHQCRHDIADRGYLEVEIRKELLGRNRIRRKFTRLKIVGKGVGGAQVCEKSGTDGGKVGNAHHYQEHLACTAADICDCRGHKTKHQQGNYEFQQLREQYIEGLEDAHQHIRSDQAKQSTEGDRNQDFYK